MLALKISIDSGSGHNYTCAGSSWIIKTVLQSLSYKKILSQKVTFKNDLVNFCFFHTSSVLEYTDAPLTLPVCKTSQWITWIKTGRLMEKISGLKELSIKKKRINILFTIFFSKMYLNTDFESVIYKKKDLEMWLTLFTLFGVY